MYLAPCKCGNTGDRTIDCDRPGQSNIWKCRITCTVCGKKGKMSVSETDSLVASSIEALEKYNEDQLVDVGKK